MIDGENRLPWRRHQRAKQQTFGDTVRRQRGRKWLIFLSAKVFYQCAKSELSVVAQSMNAIIAEAVPGRSSSGKGDVDGLPV